MTNHTMEFLASVGHFKDNNGLWIPVAVCYDTLSMSNLFNKEYLPEVLPEGWSWIMKGGNVTGAGDKTVCSEGRLKITDWKYTRARECMPLTCTMVEVPRDAVVVIGSRVMVLPTQNKLQQPGLDIVSDLTNFRMYLVAIKEVVRLDWLPLVTARTQRDPVNILSWYDGLATPYFVLYDLGFKIGMYYAIANDAIMHKSYCGTQLTRGYTERNIGCKRCAQ